MKRYIDIATNECRIRWGDRRWQYSNREGLKEYNPAPRTEDAPFGISAFVRYRNEAFTLEAAVLSALPFCDEVLLFDNLSTDDSPSIASQLASRFLKVRAFSYPFECFPSKQGHSRLAADSVHSRSYFYNFCLSHARFSHVWKWDADQIVLPESMLALRPLLKTCDIVHGSGYDLADLEDLTLTVDPTTHHEPHFFRNVSPFHYYMGEPCEFFTYPAFVGGRRTRIGNLEQPYFLHLKFALRTNIGQGWEAGWAENPYFQELVRDRKAKGAPYQGAVPSELEVLRARWLQNSREAAP